MPSPSQDVAPDAARIARDLEPALPGDVTRELLALYPDRRLSLRTADVWEAIAFAQAHTAAATKGVYISVNPLACEPGGPDSNRPSGADVPIRTALFFDVDIPAAKKAGRSPTPEERTIGREAVAWIFDMLRKHGHVGKAQRYGSSGNGFYALFPLDNLGREHDRIIRHAIDALAAGIAQRYPGIELDTGSGKDPVKVRRISGTINRSAATPARCELAYHPDAPILPLETLRSLAATRKSFADRPMPGDSERPQLTITLTPAEERRLAEVMRRYRAPGMLHNTAVSLWGFLAWSGIRWESAARVMAIVTADDTDRDDRERAGRDTYRRYVEGEDVSYRTHLTPECVAELLEERAAIRAAHAPTSTTTGTASGTYTASDGPQAAGPGPEVAQDGTEYASAEAGQETTAGDATAPPEGRPDDPDSTGWDPDALRSAGDPAILESVMGDIADRLRHYRETGSTIRGHRTGIDPLADKLGGLEAGRVTILQAQPGAGKTTFSNQVAYSLAAAGVPVVYCTFENEPADLVRKQLARIADVSPGLLDRGTLPESGYDAIDAAADRFATEGQTLYYLNGTAETTLEVIRAALVTIRNRHPSAGHPVLVLDYLQQLARIAGGNPRDDMVTRIGLVSRGLTDLAKDPALRCHVWAISSMNREAIKRGSHEMTGAKGSGDLEYDASAVLTLMKQDDSQARDSNHAALSLHVVKNRYGSTGAIELEQSLRSLAIMPRERSGPRIVHANGSAADRVRSSWR